VLRQRWFDLLFAHWPVPAARLRPLVPASLEIEEFGGTSWVGIVPFKIEGLSWRPLPDLPYFSSFPELNLRLYVEAEGKPGVWFVSLDADNAAAVLGARLAFRLPYWRAQIDMRRGDRDIEFRSVRRTQPATTFAVRYRPVGPEIEPRPGTLDYFLTERYCLYAPHAGGALRRLEIHHPRWRLTRAEAKIEHNTLASTQGIALDDARPAVLHFSARQDVVAWWPERIRPGAHD